MKNNTIGTFVMELKKRLELVRRNTAEILTDEELESLLRKKKHPSVYIGITVTGPFHMGYLIPFGKMLDFERAGIRNIILIADIHSALDDLKAPWDELAKRSAYFKKCVELGFPWEKKPRFVKGSDFQFEEKYMHDVLKLSTMSTVARATRASSEVCRMKNPKVSELIYPIMQALDEEFIGVDMQFGGIDQRHILSFAREYLPKLGYKKRVEIMTPLIASLRGPGTKMSASEPGSHIKVYDSVEDISEKIKGAYCPVGVVEDNSIIQLCQYMVFPIRGKMKIERPVKYGGDIVFGSFTDLKREYLNKSLHPADLKEALIKDLIDIFSKARKYYEKRRDLLKSLGDNFL